MQAQASIGQRFRGGNASAGLDRSGRGNLLLSHIEAPVLENQIRQCPEANGTARIRRPNNIPVLPILYGGVAVDIAAGRILDTPKDTVVVVDIHFPQPINRN